MSFDTTLGITTIDNLNTWRREDGFLVDLKTGIIFLVSVVPEFYEDAFHLVRESLTLKREGKFGVGSYFPGDVGFSTETTRKALIVGIPPPYTNGYVTLGRAKIVNKLTFEQADKIRENDSVMKAIATYVGMETPPPYSAEKIIYHLGYKFNVSCVHAMKSNKLPYVSRSGNRLSTTSGFCVVSKPLRDAVSFINCYQLVTFLETGSTIFTTQDLEEIISVPVAV